MTASTANMFNINITDHDVRLTFIDQRPKVLPDVYGSAPPRELVNEIVGEQVISLSLFRQMLDVGDKLLDEAANAKKKTEGTIQ